MLDKNKPTMICLPKLEYRYTYGNDIEDKEMFELETNLKKSGYRPIIDLIDGEWFSPNTSCLGLFTELTQYHFFQKENILVYLMHEEDVEFIEEKEKLKKFDYKVNPLLVGPRKQLVRVTLNELLPIFKLHYLRKPLTLEECYTRCITEEGAILWQTENSLASNKEYLANLEKMLFEMLF